MSVKLPKAGGPPSQKVLAGLLSGIALWGLTWIATTWIWKGGVPVSFQPVLSALAASVGFGAGGWLAKHKVTAAELAAAIEEAEKIMEAIQPQSVVFRGGSRR